MVVQWMALSKMKEIAARKEVSLEKKDEDIFQRFVVEVIRVVARGLANAPGAQGGRRRRGKLTMFGGVGLCVKRVNQSSYSSD